MLRHPLAGACLACIGKPADQPGKILLISLQSKQASTHSGVSPRACQLGTLPEPLRGLSSSRGSGSQKWGGP